MLRGALTLRCACSRIADEPKSRLLLCRIELWGSKLLQPGSFLFFCWLLAERGARANVLQLICFGGYSLTAQTHPKCSASRCVPGDHFLMLRRYSLQHKQRNFALSSMKRARL